MSLWTIFWRHWFWPVLALAVLYFAMMVWPGGKWKHIEQDVVELTQQVIADDGFDNIKVSTAQRGRDVILSGTVQSEEEKNRVILLAKTAVDEGDRIAPRIVEWAATIETPKPIVLSHGKLHLDLDSNGVVLSGVLSSQQAVDDVFTIAKNTYYDRTINNLLTVGENIKPIANVASFFQGFNTREGALFVSGDKVTLNGQVDRSELKQGIGEQVRSAIGPDYTVENNITVVEPVVFEPVVVVPEENKVCQQQLFDLMEKTNIYFSTNSADIKPSSVDTLNAIAAVLSQCPDAVIEVAGHTDSTGNDALNLILSQKRAEAVVEFLSAKTTVENKIIAVGYGEIQPVADNSTTLGRAKNRRIQFTVK